MPTEATLLLLPVPLGTGMGLTDSVTVISTTESVVKTDGSPVDAVGVRVSRTGTVLASTKVKTAVLTNVATEVPMSVDREVLLRTEAWPGRVLAVVQTLSSTDEDEPELEPASSVDEACASSVKGMVEVVVVPVRVEPTSVKVVKGVMDRGTEMVGSGMATVECSSP